MLEKLPAAVGHSLRKLRAGFDALTLEDERFRGVDATFAVTSADFADDDPLPDWSTADGPGRSPALAWSDVPATARSIALVVEDADSPTPKPLVHALAWNLATPHGTLATGELSRDAGAVEVGKNSYLKQAWLPPDPPSGHGPHRYVFQLFALDRELELSEAPGRHEVVAAMDGHVVAIGVLVGMYERA